MELKDLNPGLVWKNFHALTQIPRPSKKEGKAAEYLYEFGKSLGLETVRDEIGNVIIRKPATPGMEDCKGVILQGHIDMVPQKNADVEHDFEKDPIQAYVDGEWVRARGTTLGADNGIGVAIAMSVLESRELRHGPVEVLVTIDEETGMTGAHALKPGLLNGDILINLDSETEGELYIGCAGGLDASASIPYSTEQVPEGWHHAHLISVSGCQGGHSGMDIILCRANANKLLARVLLPLVRDYGVRLASLEGGSMRNAIPREAEAVVLIPDGKTGEVDQYLHEMLPVLMTEYAVTDPRLYVGMRACKEPASCMPEEDALRLLRALLASPEGVERMSDQMPGLVETSNNTAIIGTENGNFTIRTLMRSSVDSAKEALAEKMRAVIELAGGTVEFTGGYSGWAPDSNSQILHIMKDVYRSLYGKEPAVMAIHAGLECGILSGAYPHWDMVSCGPTILSPHSPDERVNIASVGKCWEFVKATLENIPLK